jgi:hypothetical protein
MLPLESQPFLSDLTGCSASSTVVAGAAVDSVESGLVASAGPFPAEPEAERPSNPPTHGTGRSKTSDPIPSR